MRTTVIKRSLHIAMLSLPVCALICGMPLKAMAAVKNATPATKVSFTFDDGLTSAYSQAAPTLAKYGIAGTDYVISGCVGMTTAPNTCHANTADTYMDWSQVTALQNTYGWEIGSHTVTHPYLASKDATDGQPNLLTPAQVHTEITQSKADLAAHGFNATDFATPYGDYNNAVLAEIAKSYNSHRGFADQNTNTWGYNDLLLNDFQVQAGVTVAQVEKRIDQAITSKEWLVLTFHDIKTKASTNPSDYQYNTADLATIAAYVKAKSLPTPLIRDGLVSSDVNAMPNGSLADGINDGWTTNNAVNAKADAGNNGSFPESTHSVSLTASPTSTVSLSSPKVAVDSTQKYMYKSFLNVTSHTGTGGELGYYVDEYDANGNWISGQWKKAEGSSFVEDINFQYQPTSVNVKQASLQVYVTANSGIQAYVDNFQMFSLTGTTTPAPTPVQTTDVMTNGTFDSGITSGWTTDNAGAFVADNGSHGSSANAQNSIKLTAGTTDAHLFSPRIAVKSGTNYTLKAYANVTARTASELGFYVDEYNAAGTWISGKYVQGVSLLGAQDLSVAYTPSSANVTKAALQVILPANSGIAGYLDNVQWLAPTSSVVTQPAPTNLVTGGTFDSGITAGWTTDAATNVTADAGSNGSPENVVNSVKFVAGATNAHLFSPQVAVDSTKSYSLTSYVNLKQVTGGEFGFYIDEYDANGNWISGQWKAAVSSVSARDVAFTYTPSSANVKKASLQVYVTGNSGITAYLDNVRWYQN